MALTSREARERIEAHLLGRGYSRKQGPRHTYLVHPDGQVRYMLTSRTIKRQRRLDYGWQTMGRAASLIAVASRLAADVSPSGAPAGDPPSKPAGPRRRPKTDQQCHVGGD